MHVDHAPAALAARVLGGELGPRHEHRDVLVPPKVATLASVGRRAPLLRVTDVDRRDQGPLPPLAS